MIRTLLIFVAAILPLNACLALGPQLPDENERGELSTRMSNLSSAVDMYFHELPGAPSESDSIVLQRASRRDLKNLEAFSKYLLKTQYQNHFAVVLMCSKDGKQAIIEDAGCSSDIDRQIREKSPCEFTLKVEDGCKVLGGDTQ